MDAGSSDSGSGDSGSSDSGSNDSGSSDSGWSDSGWGDSGSIDTSGVDAGAVPSDVGRTEDSSGWSTIGGEPARGHEAASDSGGVIDRADPEQAARHHAHGPAGVGDPAPPPTWTTYQPPPPPPPPVGTPRYPGGPGPFPSAPPPPPTSGAAGPAYATWGIRLLGYLVDFLIFAAFTVLLVLVMRHSHTLEVHFTMKRGTDRRRSISLLPFLVAGLAYVVYGTVLCGSRRGQTVGMMAVGVRAVRDGTFQRLGYGRAGVRAVFEGILRALELLSIALIVVWLLDMLFPLWDKKRQTLHDKVAGSVVLRGQPAR